MNKSLPDHLFSKMKECLYTPVVDILDSLGFPIGFCLLPSVRFH
ncbi:MAG: hypothetical protein ACLUOI_01740 [Eisenbergiella sp.]